MQRLHVIGIVRFCAIKNDVAFRKHVVNRCGVGFDVPVSLASIEPNEPKPKVVVEQEVAVTV